MEAGQTVISHRYIPSGLVMQRFDGIDPAFLWQLNAEAGRPDLAVIAEVHFYRQATERLVQAGFDVLRVDCNQRPPKQVAAVIRDRLTTFSASRKPITAAE